MGNLELARTGRCLCGSIRLQIARLQRDAMHCHCENCRRISGNFVAAVRVRASDLVIDDPGGHLADTDLGYAHYGFCRNCGSTLYFRAAARPDETSVMVGLLDDAAGIGLHSIWFAGQAQPHNVLDPAVPHYEGNE